MILAGDPPAYKPARRRVPSYFVIARSPAGRDDEAIHLDRRRVLRTPRDDKGKLGHCPPTGLTRLTPGLMLAPAFFLMAGMQTAISTDPVKQFSVFTENRVGRLYDLASLLAAREVHIMAITVLDTTDSAIVRLVVDDPDKARELMKANAYPFAECDLLAVEIAGETDLKTVLAALFEAEINIHYVYSFIKRPDGRSALALHVEDADVATQTLNHRGLRVLSQRDISR